MCDLNKPLVTCTLGDFIEAMAYLKGEQKPKEKEKTTTLGTRMLRGVNGIREIFSCSEYAARNILKSGVINDAIYPLGARTFVTDPDKARALYNASSQKIAETINNYKK